MTVLQKKGLLHAPSRESASVSEDIPVAPVSLTPTTPPVQDALVGEGFFGQIHLGDLLD